MRLVGWVAVVSLCAACDGRVVHQPSLLFGSVAIGESRELPLLLSSDTAQNVAFELSPGDFSIVENSLTLRPNETATLLVRFTPTALHTRTATLKIGAKKVSLTGSGAGPEITAEHPVVLPRVALLTEQIPVPTITSITVRNTGTRGSDLVLRAPRVAGTELCVGTFIGSVCERWVPPATLGVDDKLEVPLSILPVEFGARSWVMVFPSNDPLQPEIAVEVIALVEVFEACNLGYSFDGVMKGEELVLPITHLGTRRCLVEGITATSSPVNFLEVIEPASLPLTLDAEETFDLKIALRSGAPSMLSGVVRIDALGSDPRPIFFQRELKGADCLTVTPSESNFGAVSQGCGRTRDFYVYSACPVVIDSVQLAGSAEFELVQALAPGTVVSPNSGSPVSFSVTYTPDDVSADVATVKLEVRDAGFVNVPLMAQGQAAPIQVDRYRDDPLSVVDVLVMVDASPSFVPRRAVVRENLRPLLWLLNYGCTDARVGIAPADGAPDAGVQPVPNDAGVRWTASGTPDFESLVLSALDALPVGSEVEACVSPAADVMADAGVRAGSRFSGICITDALEQSPNPLASLQRIQSVNTSWSVVSSFGAACSAESLDDGVHQSLIDASHGLRGDICDPTWSGIFSFGTTCNPRRGVYYLTSMPTGPVEVRVDGGLISGADWALDVGANSVGFLPGRAPTPGTTIEISYVSLSCQP